MDRRIRAPCGSLKLQKQSELQLPLLVTLAGGMWLVRAPLSSRDTPAVSSQGPAQELALSSRLSGTQVVDTGLFAGAGL